MTSSLLASGFLSRLRRPLTVSGVFFLTLTAALCDGDDDDGNLGVSTDCIDEIDFTDAFFDEDDVMAIAVGGSRSGQVSSSDPEIENYYYDIYALGLDDDRDVTIEVDPGASFDADLTLASSTGTIIDYVDDRGPGDFEQIEMTLNDGCYVIGVSSPNTLETGSYTLTVD